MTSTYTRGGSAEGSGRIHYANGLIFDDDFEAGNLGSVRCVSDLGHGQAEYEISIRPDTNAPRYRLWFYFRVRANPAERGSSSSESSRRVVFTIVNFSKTKSLYRDGMSPLVRSTSRPRWERIPRRSVFFFRSTKHRGGGGSGASAAFVMSFVFSFDRLNSREEYFFAYSYPFTYTEQQRYLARLEAQRLPFVRRELLCRSVQGRRVDVVFIDEDLDGTGRRLAAKSSTCVGGGGGVESNMKRNPGALNGAATDKRMGRTSGCGEPSSMAAEQHRMQHELRRSKPTVVVVGRVHPGETPASFVVKGFLDFITSATDRDAERLRREVSFVVVPMLNPDGTFIGNYRTCSLGIDHNRRWAKPTHAMEPSLIAVKELITRLRANGGVDFFIDVHAHSTARHGFVLCNPPPAAAVRNATEAEQSQSIPTSQGRRSSATAQTHSSIDVHSRRALHVADITILPRIVAQNVREFSLGACKLCTDPAKAGCARRVLGADFADVVCYTLEISFFASYATAMSERDHTQVNGSDAQDGDSCPNTEHGYMGFGKQLGISFMGYYNVPRTRIRRSSSHGVS